MPLSNGVKKIKGVQFPLDNARAFVCISQSRQVNKRARTSLLADFPTCSESRYNGIRFDKGGVKTMKTLQAELPDKLYEQVQFLVKTGWFHNEKEIMTEALRRFLETHKPELMETFIKEDVEWGLRGKD